MNAEIAALPGFWERDGIIVRSVARDTVPYAVFEGSVPNLHQVTAILAWGYGLHLIEIPAEHLDLGFLEPFSRGLEYLGIADAQCRDVRPVLALHRLRELHLNVSQVANVDLTLLTRLERYSGPLHCFESVASSLAMRSLSLQRVKDGALGELAGPVEELELVDLQNVRILPKLHHPSSLQVLSLVGVGELDFAGIELFSNLETLYVDGCRVLKSVDSLVALPHLKAIAFAGCRDIRPMDALLRLSGSTISVLRRNPFEATFRAAAALSASEWSFQGAPLPK